ncbi:MAG: S8/S53 family peptidase, partial [Lentisphaeraceae bacterium]|nr:S8/S53 family peptidase [Lentisphaeraceae bacterium]
MSFTDSDKDWAIKHAKVDKAWALTPSGAGKKYGEGIYVLHPDTGYTNHPELIEGNRVSRNNSLDRSFYPSLHGAMTGDKSGFDDLRCLFASHGTSTGTVIMSEEGHPNDPNTNYPQYTQASNKFVHGAAPKAKLIPCKVTGSVALFAYEEACLAKSIFYAISLSKNDNLPVGVISISLGSIYSLINHPGLMAAIKAAKEEGIVICAAGGQSAEFLGDFNKIVAVRYPGSSDYTIGVAACDYQD